MPPAWPSFTARSRKPIRRHLRSVVKNFDPVVERGHPASVWTGTRAQLRRSALSVAASLPGGDPLASALAAGETPSPEMVAAAGPQGSLRPAVAWACLASALILIFGASISSAIGAHRSQPLVRRQT